MRRGWRGAVAAAVVIVLFLGFGALLVAWAAEDTVPEAMATRHHESSATTSSTMLPPTTTTVTTVAPEPPPPLPEPETAAPPSVQVRGIAVTLPPPDPEPEPHAAPAPAPDPEPAPVPAPVACLGPGDMLSTHNSIRCQSGVGQVGLDGAASTHAQFHAERLMNAGACGNLFHSSEMSSWYGGAWGENVACMGSSGGCPAGVGPVVDGWMSSADHRANILDPGFHYIGVGYACDGQRAYFVVHYRS